MKKDIIYFVGRSDIVRLFHRAMARNFNVHYPDEEMRLTRDDISAVKYSVMAIDNKYCNTAEMLRNIATDVILQQAQHNTHNTASLTDFRIVKGL